MRAEREGDLKSFATGSNADGRDDDVSHAVKRLLGTGGASRCAGAVFLKHNTIPNVHNRPIGSSAWASSQGRGLEQI